MSHHFNTYRLFEPAFGKTLKIIVWVNGEYKNSGHEFLLNPKYYRTWNAILGFLTTALSPNFGAVRKLIHLDSRKAVHCFSDLLSNEKYIAVGNDRLRIPKDGYKTENEKKDPRKYKTKTMKLENPSSTIDFMDYTKEKKRTVLYMMANARTCQLPCKVVLTSTDFRYWNMILKYLAYRLDIPEGVQRICTLTGHAVTDPHQLQHGDLYIAVPFNERFVKLDYVKLFYQMKAQSRPTSKKSRRTRNGALSRWKNKKIKPKKTPSPIYPSPRTVNEDCTTLALEKCLMGKGNTAECAIEGTSALTHELQLSHDVPIKSFVNSTNSADTYLTKEMFYSTYVYHKDLESPKSHTTGAFINNEVQTSAEIEISKADAQMQSEKNENTSNGKSGKLFSENLVLDILRDCFTSLEADGQMTPEITAKISSIKEMLEKKMNKSLKQGNNGDESKPLSNNNLTTFAEIARSRELGEESANAVLRSSWKSGTTFEPTRMTDMKRSVVFSNENVDVENFSSASPSDILPSGQILKSISSKKETSQRSSLEKGFWEKMASPCFRENCLSFACSEISLIGK